jgi:hypothetical protein
LIPWAWVATAVPMPLLPLRAWAVRRAERVPRAGKLGNAASIDGQRSSHWCRTLPASGARRRLTPLQPLPCAAPSQARLRGSGRPWASVRKSESDPAGQILYAAGNKVPGMAPACNRRFDTSRELDVSEIEIGAEWSAQLSASTNPKTQPNTQLESIDARSSLGASSCSCEQACRLYEVSNFARCSEHWTARARGEPTT